jgi:hypothetical protein
MSASCFENGDETTPSSSSSSSSSSSPRTNTEDLLTVFQAAPLAWVSAADDVAHPMKAIDFEFERDLLTKTFQECVGTGIRVEYEIATTDRLGFFLAKGEGHILHFSCHGHPTYLALEDEWGGLMMLEVSRLQEWISAGGKNLQFVFVSACYSSLIGDAFVKAGVPHVLCCRYDSMLREDAAGTCYACVSSRFAIQLCCMPQHYLHTTSCIPTTLSCFSRVRKILLPKSRMRQNTTILVRFGMS